MSNYMHYTQKLILFLIFFFLVSAFGYTVPFSDLAEKPDSDYPLSDTVRWEKGMIPILNLLPDVPGAASIRNRFFNYRPEVTVQRLYRLPLADHVDVGSTEGRRK